jgi:predicted nucleic acid-binding protein
VNVVDSSGWVEFLRAGPQADFFAPAILKTNDLIVPAISLYEVFKKVLHEQGEGSALRAVAQMKQGRVVDLDEAIALQAARLSLRQKLPMADALIYATAQLYKAVLWTQDEHFRNLPKVRYVAKS